MKIHEPSFPYRMVDSIHRPQVRQLFNRNGLSMCKRIISASLLLMVSGNCNPAATKPSSRPALNIYVATSLADVVSDLRISFPAAEVITTSGPSGLLCTQIENHAPADVVITAERSYITRLSEKNLVLPESVRLIAGNHLVLVRHHGSDGTDANLSILLSDDIHRIAIGNPDHVPAGRYAMQALRHAGIDQQIRDKLIFADDARMAARYSAEGSVDAAIIYATDAAAFARKDSITFQIPDKMHDPIEYVAAICTASHEKDVAQRWIDLLTAPTAQSILVKHGFSLPVQSTTSGQATP
jgi:molybdate transport system substrate-binding protein